MSDLLADRYGAKRPARTWLTIGLAALVVGAGLVWLGWAIWGTSTPQVQSSLRGYDVVDAHTARAVVDVQLSKTGIHARCHLEALAADHTTVGDLDFTPPPGRRRSTVTESVRTERRAATVTLQGCTTHAQKRPR